MPAELSVRVLGALDVSCDGTRIGPAGVRRRSLFAVLAVRAGEVCDLDQLVAGIWGEHPPQSATAVLQTYISTWRKALDAAGVGGPGRLTTVGSAYRLRLEPAESDLLRFGELTAAGRRAAAAGHETEGSAILGRALSLWRGPVLPTSWISRFTWSWPGRWRRPGCRSSRTGRVPCWRQGRTAICRTSLPR